MPQPYSLPMASTPRMTAIALPNPIPENVISVLCGKWAGARSSFNVWMPVWTPGRSAGWLPRTTTSRTSSA
ncbi:MAG: hypothetical protein E6J41_25675 [Chloroflexi bacterium]|nr:MAG: hypothetical protein E6J41_25675 [Chloroflexota bacterium]